MTKEFMRIGNINYCKITEGNKVKCEAYHDNCTGHGSTFAEALLDLRSKIKQKELKLKESTSLN